MIFCPRCSEANPAALFLQLLLFIASTGGDTDFTKDESSVNTSWKAIVESNYIDTVIDDTVYTIADVRGDDTEQRYDARSRKEQDEASRLVIYSTTGRGKGTSPSEPEAKIAAKPAAKNSSKFGINAPPRQKLQRQKMNQRVSDDDEAAVAAPADAAAAPSEDASRTYGKIGTISKRNGPEAASKGAEPTCVNASCRNGKIDKISKRNNGPEVAMEGAEPTFILEEHHRIFSSRAADVVGPLNEPGVSAPTSVPAASRTSRPGAVPVGGINASSERADRSHD